MIPGRLQGLVDESNELAERFAALGHRLYLVGGIVRDAIVDRLREGSDLDLTTDARPDDIEMIVRPIADAVWTQGKQFGTIGFRRGTRNYEITTHRAEAYRPDSRKPTVEFANAVEADLSRRDFTVNSMALELTTPTPTLVDPFNGVADLASHTLRTPLSAEESFSDDPLRMLRAARFIAGYGLAPVDDLRDAIVAMRDRLEIVSPERIRDELDRLLVVEKPGTGLWFLVETGLAGEFLPELPALGLEQDPIHRHKDVLAHTIAVVEKTSAERILRLAALFHDVGKPKTRSIGPGGVSFHHHEVVGARMTRDRMRALHYSNEDVEAVTRLVELHLRFHGYSDDVWTDSAIRRYVRDAGPLLAQLNELTRCDCTTRNAARARALNERMDDLERNIVRLRAEEELDAIRPDLNGNEVMALLGLSPGPEVGDAMRYLLELRLEEGPLGTEEATRRLRDWWATRSPA